MDDTVTVKFLETRVVQDTLEGTKDETCFRKGRTYKLSPRSAKRWIERGVAVEHTAKPRKKPGRNGRKAGSAK